MGPDRPHRRAQPRLSPRIVSTDTEVGFCPRCQATRTLRIRGTLALKRSAHETRLVWRRQVDCPSCNTFLSMVETQLRTEVIAGAL